MLPTKIGTFVTRTGLAGVTLALASIFGIFSSEQANAGDAGGWYGCHTDTCPGNAECKGDFYLNSGDCKVTCYKPIGEGGQVGQSGSAGCGAKEP